MLPYLFVLTDDTLAVCGESGIVIYDRMLQESGVVLAGGDLRDSTIIAGVGLTQTSYRVLAESNGQDVLMDFSLRGEALGTIQLRNSDEYRVLILEDGKNKIFTEENDYYKNREILQKEQTKQIDSIGERFIWLEERSASEKDIVYDKTTDSTYRLDTLRAVSPTDERQKLLLCRVAEVLKGQSTQQVLMVYLYDDVPYEAEWVDHDVISLTHKNNSGQTTAYQVTYPDWDSPGERFTAVTWGDIAYEGNPDNAYLQMYAEDRQRNTLRYLGMLWWGEWATSDIFFIDDETLIVYERFHTVTQYDLNTAKGREIRFDMPDMVEMAALANMWEKSCYLAMLHSEYAEMKDYGFVLAVYDRQGDLLWEYSTGLEQQIDLDNGVHIHLGVQGDVATIVVYYWFNYEGTYEFDLSTQTLTVIEKSGIYED